MAKFITPSNLVAVLAFVIVSSPETYKLTSGLAGDWIANATGRAQPGGLVLHAVVFLVLLAVLKMVLPKGLSGYDGEPAEIM
jgi:hypothetical protein